MTDQATGAAEQPAEAPSIQDEIRAAFAEAEGTAPETPAAEGDSAAAQRARDEKGRFAKAEVIAAEQPIEGAEKAPEAEPAAETEVKPDPAATAPGEAPQHWSAEDKALVAKLPPELRGEYVDRFKKMEAGFAPKLQRAAALEKDYGEVDRMFEPALQAMQAQGWSKPGLIKAWSEVESGLARDPIEQVGKIIKHYKVDTAELAKRLGLAGAAPAANGAAAAQPGAEPIQEYIDPTVKALQDQIKELTGTVTGLTTAQQAARAAEEQARTQRTLNEIQAFADAKGEDGSPSHPLFNEVMPNILALAAAERSAGRTPVLTTLYDQAVWANPETRAKQLAATKAAEQRQAAALAKDKAAAARKAGSSVTGSPSAGGQTVKPTTRGSIADDVRAAFDQASA